MMGTKIRTFSPLPRDVSLEELVPKDNFYRRLQARLDLSFVRELVRPLYANGGRPSVDPVVFFKLQLVMFFEDIRSERPLMGVVSDRLCLCWYLGYDPFEPLPDHSSLTRIRERFGLVAPAVHRPEHGPRRSPTRPGDDPRTLPAAALLRPAGRGPGVGYAPPSRPTDGSRACMTQGGRTTRLVCVRKAQSR